MQNIGRDVDIYLNNQPLISNESLGQYLVKKLNDNFLVTPKNKDKMEFNEVIRKYLVYIIGDLDGSLESYNHYMKSTKLFDQNEKMYDKNIQLIFLGDILADRNPYGFDILYKIHSLRTQNISINVLAGNHEINIVDFFDDEKKYDNYLNIVKSGKSAFDGLANKDAYKKRIGYFELLKFSSKPYKKISSIDDAKYVFDNIIIPERENIISKMRKEYKGRVLLFEINNMKLLEQIDDTLFVHTNPTEGILDLILQYSPSVGYKKKDIGIGIQHINNIRQYRLKNCLFGEYKNINEKEYETIKNILLIGKYGDKVIGNRESSRNPYQYEVFRNSGINTLMHGHNLGAEFGGDGEIGGIRIIDIDRKSGPNGDAISLINKNGNIFKGNEMIKIR